jgi:hypothetical protein
MTHFTVTQPTLVVFPTHESPTGSPLRVRIMEQLWADVEHRGSWHSNSVFLGRTVSGLYIAVFTYLTSVQGETDCRTVVLADSPRALFAQLAPCAGARGRLAVHLVEHYDVMEAL